MNNLLLDVITVIAVMVLTFFVFSQVAKASLFDDLVRMLPIEPEIIFVEGPPTKVCGHNIVAVNFDPHVLGEQTILVSCGEYLDEDNYLRTCVKADGYVGHGDERVFSETIHHPPQYECLPVPEPSVAKMLGVSILATLLARRHDQRP